MATSRPVLLAILDGWGMRFTHEGNAVLQGNTPNYDRWLKELECAVIDASGEAVGLIEGQMGNSEVGHLNLGAGRVVYQDISRINNAIRDEQYQDLLFNKLDIESNNSQKVHVIGLLGPGGVHSHQDHLEATLQALETTDKEVIIHIITDGRDTPPHSSLDFLATLEDFIASENISAKIATVSGRYYAMDRDKRWERTTKAYDVMVNSNGKSAASAQEAIEQSHADGVTDEFILPTVISSVENGTIDAGDSIVFYNFRADRMRQIVQFFAYEDFEHRDLDFVPDLKLVTMTQYADEYPVEIMFPIEKLDNTLAETLAKNDMTQFHIAETEKYPHVTYFFNGRREKINDGEDRTIVPSPKVATYDLQPEMSAYEVRDTVLNRLQEHDDDFILINFANPDMVGHTGSLEAAITAVETVDACIGEIVDAVLAKGGAAIVTADHGNSELMFDYLSEGPHTYHTTNPVPLFVIVNDEHLVLTTRGKLADVAPTVLDLLGVEQPTDMTGNSLIRG